MFLNKIDSLPTGADWTCEIVTVPGDIVGEDGQVMVEELELWKRDPVECVKELMGNPAFKDFLAYVPERVFTDPSGKNRIIDEAWTADWWWKIQVSARSYHRERSLQSNHTGEAAPRFCRYTGYPGLGQDTAHSVCGRQVSVASLPNHRQHLQGDSTSAVRACHIADRLPSCREIGLLHRGYEVARGVPALSQVHVPAA